MSLELAVNAAVVSLDNGVEEFALRNQLASLLQLSAANDPTIDDVMKQATDIRANRNPVRSAVQPSTDLSAVPEVLKQTPRWVWWKLETRDGKPTKTPFIAHTDRHASSTDPATWVSFEKAVDGAVIGNESGIGFVVDGSDDILGFDLDGCRNPETGELAEWAERIIRTLNSYTEITPSRTGVRIWVRGKLPDGLRVFNLNPSAGFGTKVKIEIYDRDRYFTMTGELLDTLGSVEVERRDDLTGVYKLCHEIRNQHPVAERKAANEKTQGVMSSTPIIVSPGYLAPGKLDLLMNGMILEQAPFRIGYDWAYLQYPSQSEADEALATVLAFEHGDNPELIEEEFSKSALGQRAKWTGREGYRNSTITKAIETAKQKLSQAQIPPTTPASADPIVVVSGDDFLVEQIPPRKVLVSTVSTGEPVIFEQSINQVFAWRGLGKTNLGLGFVRALATGGRFLNFKAEGRSHVLYIEGELPDSQFQERWMSIVGKTAGYAHLASVDKQPGHHYVSMANHEGMQKVEKTLADLKTQGVEIKVLMLDNISTLFNVKANEEEVWIPIQSWFTSLRSRGITIFFLHHAGKGGLSRSHSKSEDMLDVSIKLEEPDEPEQGHLHALLTFDKARAGLNERPAEIKLHRTHSVKCQCHGQPGVLFCPGDGVRWEHIPLTSKRDEAYRLFSEGKSILEVIGLLDAKEGTVRMWRTNWNKSQQNQIKMAAA